LHSLVTDGLISRQPGSGTRIVREGRGGYWAIGSLDDLTGEFRVDQQLTLRAKNERVDLFPAPLKIFNLKSNSNIFHMVRLLTNGGLPSAFSHLFALPSLTKRIPENELSTTFLLELLQKYNRSIISRTRQETTATLADRETAEFLGMERNAPVLLVKRTYFSAGGAPVLYVELSCRPDRYCQVVNFVRSFPQSSRNSSRRIVKD
jgi:DNA-binding GntR family transcriptional regulator